jgi:hypothetical protein
MLPESSMLLLAAPEITGNPCYKSCISNFIESLQWSLTFTSSDGNGYNYTSVIILFSGLNTDRYNRHKNSLQLYLSKN